MFNNIHVPVVSNNGLTKELYEFEICGTKLEYTSYWKYNRDAVTDPWPDKWPEPMSQSEWLEQQGIEWEEDYENEDYENEGYRKYYDAHNPCMNKTKDGRVMGTGSFGGNTTQVHPLPPGAKEFARLLLIALVEV